MNLLPIETAPKDGTWILLFGETVYKLPPLRCEVCKWNEQYTDWETLRGKWFGATGNEATHWCPIPSLPQDVVLPEKTVADEPVKDDAALPLSEHDKKSFWPFSAEETQQILNSKAW